MSRSRAVSASSRGAGPRARRPAAGREPAAEPAQLARRPPPRRGRRRRGRRPRATRWSTRDRGVALARRPRARGRPRGARRRASRPRRRPRAARRRPRSAVRRGAGGVAAREQQAGARGRRPRRARRACRVSAARSSIRSRPALGVVEPRRARSRRARARRAASVLQLLVDALEHRAAGAPTISRMQRSGSSATHERRDVAERRARSRVARLRRAAPPRRTPPAIRTRLRSARRAGSGSAPAVISAWMQLPVACRAGAPPPRPPRRPRSASSRREPVLEHHASAAQASIGIDAVLARARARSSIARVDRRQPLAERSVSSSRGRDHVGDRRAAPRASRRRARRAARARRRSARARRSGSPSSSVASAAHRLGGRADARARPSRACSAARGRRSRASPAKSTRCSTARPPA